MLIADAGYNVPYASRTSLRFVIGVGALMLMVISYAYTSSLISYLTVIKLQPIVHNFEELANDNRYTVTAELNSAFTTAILV